jgi:hypothetical protein
MDVQVINNQDNLFSRWVNFINQLFQHLSKIQLGALRTYSNSPESL